MKVLIPLWRLRELARSQSGITLFPSVIPHSVALDVRRGINDEW